MTRIDANNLDFSAFNLNEFCFESQAQFLGDTVKYVFLVLSIGLSFPSPIPPSCCAQDANDKSDSQPLTIGSRAPQLEIEHWMSNGDGQLEETREFKKDKVYVVEFWATWCRPCIASMPHLSELQEKYSKNGLQIISVSDEKLEIVEKFLKRKVTSDSDKTYGDLTSNYCLTTDPDGTTNRQYLEAAGLNSIPNAFIVGKTGLIEWIGHPMEIDNPLERILSDKWDRSAFATEFQESKDFGVTMQRVVQMYRAKKIDDAVQLLNRTISRLKSKKVKTQASVMRLQMLVTSGNKNAPKAVNEFAESTDDAEMLNEVAWNIFLMSQQIELDPRIPRGAIQCVEKAVKLAPKAPHIWDTLAHLVAEQGDLNKAIEHQQKAVELDATKDPQLTEFLSELQKLKKEDKSSKESGKDDSAKSEQENKKKSDKFDF